MRRRILKESHNLDHATANIDYRVAPAGIRGMDLVLDCGYFDQSHLINQFRAFSGIILLEDGFDSPTIDNL